MIKRYATAVAVGALVTLGVLFTMPRLIARQQSHPGDSDVRDVVAFVRADVEPPKPPKPPEPPKPRPDDKPGPPRSTNSTHGVDPLDPEPLPGPGSVPPSPVPRPDPPEPFPSTFPIDRALEWWYKPDPEYDRHLIIRGIEGHCVVEYTVTVRGTVKDVVVIDAEPKGAFERASVKAALKYKYRPPVVNGEPIEVRGVRTRIEFRLPKSETRTDSRDR
jgi:protein TonB